MDKIEVTILEPKAEAMLDKMANRKLIKLKKLPRVKAKKRSTKKVSDRIDFYISGPVMSDLEYDEYVNARKWMDRWRAI